MTDNDKAVKIAFVMGYVTAKDAQNPGEILRCCVEAENAYKEWQESLAAIPQERT